MVLTHPDLDISKHDNELYSCVLKFKKWFVSNYFRGLYIDERGKPHAPNHSKTVSLIKKLSAWVSYYSAFSPERNIRPKVIAPIPGGSENGFQILPLFGGHLAEWARPWLLKPKKHNVFVMSQMLSFSRALPTPPKEELDRVSFETIDHLTSTPSVGAKLVELYEEATTFLTSIMDRMSTRSHCSITSSGSYEHTSEEGGNAMTVTSGVRELLGKNLQEIFVENPDCDLFDPFGRKVLSRDLINSLWEYPIPIGYFLYRDFVNHHQGLVSKVLPAHANKLGLWSVTTHKGKDTMSSWVPPKEHGVNKEIVREQGDDGLLYNHLLGEEVLLWAFTCALAYGKFSRDPVSINIALFRDGLFPITWEQSVPVPCQFMALAEPGWKSRPLTKNCAWVNILQSSLRHAIDESISGDPRIGLGLTSAYALWDALKRAKNRAYDPSYYALNTDLEQATNRLPHEIVEAIWRGMYKGLGVIGTPHESLWGFSNLSHEIHVRRGLEEDVYPHTCGTLMGEPTSFAVLSLYNLCTAHIASVMSKCEYKEPEDVPAGDLCYDFRSVSFDVIIGDDMLRFTNEPRLADLTRKLHVLTNARHSVGKDTISTCHLSIAENHCWFNGQVLNQACYLDIIKSRLLTPSTRFHAESQSSIIGKGKQLSQQLSWYSISNKSFGERVSKLLRGVYDNIVRDLTSETMYLQLENLPACFPPNFGGIGFGVTPDIYELKRRYPFEINFIIYLLKAPLHIFMEEALLMNELTDPARRGLPHDDVFSIIARSLRSTSAKQKFDPDDSSFLYSVESGISWIASHPEVGPTIPRVFGTDRPQYRHSLEKLHEVTGFIPLDVVIDQFVRVAVFGKAFREGPSERPIGKLGKYVRNMTEYWQRARLLYRDVVPDANFAEYFDPPTDHSSMPSWFVPRYSDPLSNMHLKWALKRRLLVHKDSKTFLGLASAPTLALDFSRVTPIFKTEGTPRGVVETSLSEWFRTKSMNQTERDLVEDPSEDYNSEMMSQLSISGVVPEDDDEKEED